MYPADAKVPKCRRASACVPSVESSCYDGIQFAAPPATISRGDKNVSNEVFLLLLCVFDDEKTVIADAAGLADVVRQRNQFRIQSIS